MTRMTAGLALLLGVFSVAQAESLLHDPFTRPLLSAPTSAATGATTGVASADPKIDPVSAWNPALTAIMVAGKHSLVNIEGKIIRIGEDFDGYRLIQVKDGEAIFKKDNQRVVLRMGSQAPAENKRLR